MKKVITYGSFDLFHEGHYRLLERAKQLGDYLIVGVTTEQYDEYRGKLNVVDSLMQRIENIRQTNLADEIIIETHTGQKIEDIQKYGIDLFVVGSDWRGQFDYIKQYCEVCYLERTKGVSSTMKRQQNMGIVRLGIIGTGRIAKRFVVESKYVSGTNLEGAYNPNLKSAQKFVEDFELKFYTDDIQAFFDKVDAVYIASPHTTHYAYAKTALNSGKHVLCEKPLVFSEAEAIELFELAREKGLVLMEAIKTAYSPGFGQLLAIAKSGIIGEIKDVEACFTKLTAPKGREFNIQEEGGSFTELGSYPLLAIIKLMGIDYERITFDSFMSQEGIDVYTKAYIRYRNTMCTAKVGLGVKSEGQLVISGTRGYIYVEAPWWKTESFEVRYEDPKDNEKFFFKFLGDGLRYELGNFIAIINGNTNKSYKLTEQESIEIACIMEAFLKQRKI